MQSTCPLLPRFYSIASSLEAHPEELHLTVELLSFPCLEETRFGVASHFLCNLATETTPIPIYHHPNLHFSLPKNPETPIIMVGPGTGIAPFRSFVQHRVEQSVPGKNWLFFGDRHEKYDFLYEEYWKTLHASNQLLLDLAFSRDQKEKIYVQHKMEEKSSTLWQWLEEGAHIYVCGDAKAMAKDVHATLYSIIEKEGSLSKEDAKTYLKKLRLNKRYVQDVY